MELGAIFPEPVPLQDSRSPNSSWILREDVEIDIKDGLTTP